MPRKTRRSRRPLLHPLCSNYNALHYGVPEFAGLDADGLRDLWQQEQERLTDDGDHFYDRRGFVCYWLYERDLDHEHAFEAAALATRTLQAGEPLILEKIETQARRIVLTGDPRLDPLTSDRIP